MVTVLLLLVSCNREARRMVIPEKKLMPFLVDLHLAESVAGQSNRGKEMVYKIDSASLYGSVFRKHGVTMAMFDSTMVYYSIRPEELQEIYNQVHAELRRREDELSLQRQQAETATSEILWQSDNVYMIRGISGNKIEIDIPITGQGIYAVSAVVKILPSDMSLDPRMSLYFYRDDGSGKGRRLRFQEIRYTSRTGEDKTYRTAKRLTEDGYTHLRGYIINFTNGDTLFNRNMLVKDIVVSKRTLESEREGEGAK